MRFTSIHLVLYTGDAFMGVAWNLRNEKVKSAMLLKAKKKKYKQLVVFIC